MGTKLTGMGFIFDDASAKKGETESIAEMERLIQRNPANVERIVPYIGGEEVNNSPTHSHVRYAIDFVEFPLARDSELKPWFGMTDHEHRACLTKGIVPADYPRSVAADWPDLLAIVQQRVKPQREKLRKEGCMECSISRSLVVVRTTS
jgi:hypothetical protein